MGASGLGQRQDAELAAGGAVQDAQDQNLGPETFQGKKALLYVEAKPEGEKEGFDNRNFVTRAQAEKIKASLGAAGATATGPQAAAAGLGGAATPQPSAAGGLKF